MGWRERERGEGRESCVEMTRMVEKFGRRHSRLHEYSSPDPVPSWSFRPSVVVARNNSPFGAELTKMQRAVRGLQPRRAH